ncbi:MAG: hypothetical protein FWE22_05625 [Firmicutes bacterium]|nr:hypothetical protein [Bacillota bacterium]
MKKFFAIFLVLIFLLSIVLVVVGFTTDIFDLNDGEPVITREDLDNAHQAGFNQGFQLGTRELQTFRDRIEELENEVEYWQNRYAEMREYLEGIIRELNEKILSQMAHVDVLHNLIIYLVDYGLGNFFESNSFEFLQTLEQVYLTILGQIENDIAYLNWWLDEILPSLFPPITHLEGYTFEQVVFTHSSKLAQWNGYNAVREFAITNIQWFESMIGANPSPDRWGSWQGQAYCCFSHNPACPRNCPATGRTRTEWEAQVGWTTYWNWWYERDYFIRVYSFNRQQSINLRPIVDRYYSLLQQFNQLREERLIQITAQRAIAEHMLGGQISAREHFETRLIEVRERIKDKSVEDTEEVTT